MHSHKALVVIAKNLLCINRLKEFKVNQPMVESSTQLVASSTAQAQVRWPSLHVYVLKLMLKDGAK